MSRFGHDRPSLSHHQTVDLSDAYAFKVSVILHHGSTDAVVDYNALHLSTLGVFCVCTGTVIRKKVLWIEQLFIGLSFILVGLRVWALKATVGIENDKETVTFVHGFSDKMATLITFPLAFYTYLAVSRWWRLRIDGVGTIWAATSTLSMLISQLVARDAQVLSAIRRYVRASLMMIFMMRKYGAELFPTKLGELKETGILTEQEVLQLQEWNNNLA